MKSQKRSIDHPSRHRNSRSRKDLLQQKIPAPRLPLRQPIYHNTLHPDQQPRRQYGMPDSTRNLALPQTKVIRTSALSARGRGSKSLSRSRSNKPSIQQRVWIPGGHPNSIGRNKIASIGRPLHLDYQRSVERAQGSSAMK